MPIILLLYYLHTILLPQFHPSQVWMVIKQWKINYLKIGYATYTNNRKLIVSFQYTLISMK